MKVEDCYVDIWRDANFEGESLRLYGPAEFPNLRFMQGNWADQIGSLRVGPCALVLAYRDAEFRNQRITFGPNDEIPDLHALRFDDDIDSVQVIDSMKIFDRLLGRTYPPEERKKGKGKKR